MATPNLVNIATITPKNAMGSLSDTNRTTMIDVPAETAVRIDTILLANIDGTNAVDATVEISNDNGQEITVTNISAGEHTIEFYHWCGFGTLTFQLNISQNGTEVKYNINSGDNPTNYTNNTLNISLILI